MAKSARLFDLGTHADQSLPYEWAAFELDDETLLAHDVPEGTAACHRVAGTTRNVRTIAHADAVLYQGTIVEPIYEPATRSIVVQHTWAGTMDRWSLAEWLEEPVVLLDRLPATTLTGGDRDV